MTSGRTDIQWSLSISAPIWWNGTLKYKTLYASLLLSDFDDLLVISIPRARGNLACYIVIHPFITTLVRKYPLQLLWKLDFLPIFWSNIWAKMIYSVIINYSSSEWTICTLTTHAIYFHHLYSRGNISNIICNWYTYVHIMICSIV